MLFIYLAIYIVILLVAWGFYAVARMHTMKFKNFSTHIVPVTNFMAGFLVFLSILGFIFIFFVLPEGSNYEISTSSERVLEDPTEPEVENFREEIIGEDYY